MEFKDLIEQLRDTDPWARVEVLRILAMVEETRALKAIEWVFKNDPEPGVRQVAQWSGRIVWAAAQREESARSTQTMTPVEREQARKEMEEELLLNRLVIDQARASETTAMEAKALEYELNRLLKDAANKKRSEGTV